MQSAWITIGSGCTYINASLALTFTGLYTLRPCVISVSVGRPSAVLGPRTTGSATTDLAGFLEGAALETCHHTDSGRGDGWRAGCSGDGCPDYEFSIR